MVWDDNISADRPLDFFISYSPADERWATWIAGTLEGVGYRTMLQAWDFVPGTNFIEFMDRGVSQAAVVLAVLSRNYLQSRYGRMEWQAALRADPDTVDRRLVTVRVEDCHLEGLLASITYLDMLGVDDPEEARTRLLTRVGQALAGRAKPAVRPAYPNGGRGEPGLAPPPRLTQSVRPHARRLPVVTPPYPLATPTRATHSGITLLHIAGPCFGRGLGAGALPTAKDLQSRISGDLTQLVHDGAAPPDLVVVTGDLTASGNRRQSEEALNFLTGLRVLLGLEPNRLVVVPGGLDVNRAACQAYFSSCAADDLEPRLPYWPKWRHFTRLFQELYQGIDDLVFESDQPWTVFTVPELRLVVAGINTSMRASHRDEDQYGWIDTEQAAWFAQRLRPYEDHGWLRVGVMRHVPGEPDGDALLRDTDTFSRLLAPRLNLLVHGPGGTRTGPASVAGLTCVSVSAPGSYQLVTVTPEGLTRRVARPAGTGGEPERIPVQWRAAGAAFRSAEAPVPDAPPVDETATPEVREAQHPAGQLLDRIVEVCEARYERHRIHRVDGDPPYLIVTYTEDDFIRRLCVTAHVGEPSPADVEALRQQVQATDPDLTFELVFEGPPPRRELRDEAMRAGVRVRSFTEFQGLLDLRSYVAEQTERLSTDRQYPPELYVPQRFRELDRADQPVHEDLVEALLQMLSTDHGRFVLLLGDFGRGKTFALRELAQRIPVEMPHLIPIFIELRALDKAHNVDGLVAAHLADHGEETIDLRAFHYMLRQGRIVLLFDGFDELVTRVSYERAADHLDTLLRAAADSAKIVVTSRTQHFRSHAQVLTALGERVGLLPHRRVLSIEQFTPRQIRAYLLNHYRGDEAAAEARLRLIGGIEDLLGLAHNPRMLSFVANLDDERLRAVAQAGHALSAAGLYREILSAWLAFEERRTTIRGAAVSMSLDDLWRAVTTLALRLWEVNESVLRLADLTEVAETLSGLTKGQLSAPQAAQSIGSGSLLVRTEEGLFGFIHGSVVEWLVAHEIAARLREDDPALLSRRALSQLTVDFLCDLADVRKCQDWTREVLADPEADEIARTNALKVSTRLRVPARTTLRGASLQGEDLSYRDLAEVDLTDADLTDARLVGANLSRANLRHARLTGAWLDEAILTGADLTGADLTRARLVRTQLRHATLTGSRWRRAALIAASTDPGVGDVLRAGGAAVAPGMPVGTELRPAGIGVPYGFHIQYGRLPQPLSYSPDGEVLAVGCNDGGTVLCDALSGLPLRTLQGHRGRVYLTAHGRGDDTLITAAADGTVRSWNAADGTPRWTRADYHDWVWPVVLSTGGNWLATGDSTGALQLLDAESGEVRHELPHPTAPLWSAEFRPGDAQLACGASDGVVRLWNTATGVLERELGGHDTSVYRVIYAPDGTVLATADALGVVRVWDVDSGVLRHTLTGHTRAVYTVDFHPGGWLLASADTAGTIRLWDPATGVALGVLDRHTSSIYRVRFSPDGTMLASCDSGGAVRLWSVSDDAETPVQLQAELTGHRAAVWPCVFRPDGAQLATASTDSTVRLWDTATGQPRHVLRGHGRRVSSISFNGSGSMVAACGNDGVVRLWNPVTGQQVRQLTGAADQLVSATFSPIGELLGAASNDGGVYLFNAGTGVAERELDVETPNVWAESFSPDGTLLATANDDDTVRLWRHTTGAEGRTLREHRGRVRSIAFAPDGVLLATGCDDSKLRLWDVQTRECLATLQGHTDRVYSVAFHPGGELLASASWDGSVRIWQSRAGSCVQVLTEHVGPVWTAAFHPSGQLLASAGDDSVIRLWDPDTGRHLAALPAHTGRVYAISFSPDGRTLASGGDDGSLRLWDIAYATRASLRATLMGLPEGWVAVAPDGRYKMEGSTDRDFWHVVGACRFEPGEIEAHLSAVQRIALEAPF